MSCSEVAVATTLEPGVVAFGLVVELTIAGGGTEDATDVTGRPGEVDETGGFELLDSELGPRAADDEQPPRMAASDITTAATCRRIKASPGEPRR